jgi:hypothetical protein
VVGAIDVESVGLSLSPAASRFPYSDSRLGFGAIAGLLTVPVRTYASPLSCLVIDAGGARAAAREAAC